MTSFKAALLCAATLALATPAAADQHDASGHQGHGSATAGESPASAAFRAANSKMHEAMTLPLSGDADADFLRAMIPHHEGALDMARIELKHGKNAAARELAERIVAAQEREIAEMKALLAQIEAAPSK
ncbi:uncharacterized protein (DUF305 family) [Methylopila capsulata]|uniref:Uncharacterized protein (DUF305 family) n=1 Tax=Methylopila capsulata TaxID=61654 RepID=A0A9W6IYD0_9HYPH|nr:DUF305 domain-containing protein [Methylopila capsulata]MBM7853367.1 uncharacterized protein (DUF305 family) [Methylopila capsulata]GLK57420.1 hypothetical protein GCM10008170_34400 [Methylopila capsulata]